MFVFIYAITATNQSLTITLYRGQSFYLTFVEAGLKIKRCPFHPHFPKGSGK